MNVTDKHKRIRTAPKGAWESGEINEDKGTSQKQHSKSYIYNLLHSSKSYAHTSIAILKNMKYNVLQILVVTFLL